MSLTKNPRDRDVLEPFKIEVLFLSSAENVEIVCKILHYGNYARPLGLNCNELAFGRVLEQGSNSFHYVCPIWNKRAQHSGFRGQECCSKSFIMSKLKIIHGLLARRRINPQWQSDCLTEYGVSAYGWASSKTGSGRKPLYLN
jgi:hypothetical protein